MITKGERMYEHTYIRMYGTDPIFLHIFVVRGDKNSSPSHG